jgi:2-polyprenyl-6-methoxyphenol hydroxylase-like FAD-dependent oxidoreductase
MAMAQTPVLIVGAGPTGLVLALSLLRQGITPRLVDRRSGPGQASRAMVVHARTLEFYAQLGIADAVIAAGIKATRIHLREHAREVATVSFTEMGTGLSPYPYVLCFPQDDHERLLVEQVEAAGLHIEWNTELTGFTQDASGVQANLTAPEGRSTCNTAYLCGCDGAHSVVRHGIGVEFGGGSYAQLYYVADVAIDGGFDTDIHVSLAAHGLGLMLPVRSRGMQRLIGIVPEDISAGMPAGTEPGFEDIRPSVESLLGVRVTRLNWFSTYRVHHRVASAFRQGRAFISGDAAHLHSPAGGQGMNTGIGDAFNLAWKLAQVLHGRVDPAILDSYEPERMPFARKLVATTDRAFQFLTGQGWASEALRRFVLPNLAPIFTSFAAARRGLFATVSQTRITYRDSPLSQGEAGHVHGGDRMPFVESGTGNFATLKSLDWRLQIHGAVSDALAQSAATRSIAIDRFDWSEAASRAGLVRDAAYFLRPDGHVGLVLPQQDPATLDRYLAMIGFRQPA